MSLETGVDHYGAAFPSLAHQPAARASKELGGVSREEAYSRCPADSYVEYYGGQWLIVPFEAVEQPRVFVCQPGDHALVA